MKKLKLFILTIIMLFTVLPVNIFADEDNTSDEPDVSVYATKEQLMDDTFRPNDDGTAKNIGKVVFGKNSSGNPQEWYVLGKDDGVNNGENNTVIFAASPIATNQIFKLYNENNAYTYTYEKGTGYGDSDGTIIVYENHYGASDLRAALKAMATNTSFFTATEQGLMNDTTATTNDTKNGVNYTTTDKLYAPAADESNAYSPIKAGSDNSKEISLKNYTNDGYEFWLRIPDKTGNFLAFRAVSGKEVGNRSVHNSIAVQPASNIDLTNVLFASAAKDGSLGPLNKEDPMLLRFDGSGKNIGDISYDNNNIYVSSNGSYTLIVQGRNGEQNWYYTFQLAGNNFVIRKNDIIQGLKIDTRNPVSLADIDLSKCKIWIENKELDGLIYAVEAKKAISSVDISIETPVAGKLLTTNANCATTGIDSTMPLITWDTTDETAIYSKTYKASVTLTPKTGYVFVNMNTAGGLVQTSANVIRNPATDIDVTVNNDGTLTVSFDLAAKDNILDIEQPALTYENGTPIDEFKLPDKVKVTGYSGKEYQLAIFPWEAHPDNNYDPECKDEQTLVYYSGLKDEDIPGELNYSNPDGPDVKLTITIKAAKTSNNTGGSHTVIIPDTAVR